MSQHRAVAPNLKNVSRDYETGRSAIRAEAEALVALADSLGEEFEKAVDIILQSKGKVIVTGMGKSGHISRKIAATLASTGTPAMFVHPAEASHGDLGVIARNDVVIAISKSGESPELSDIIEYAKRIALPLIAITCERASTLGRMAGTVLLMPQVAEVCPIGLAPTTSTTMSLALGDAIAVTCLKRRDFRVADFGEFHPGGKLGLRLKRVKDVMYQGSDVPLVRSGSQIGDAIIEMSRTKLGCVGIIDTSDALVGIFTDGDLRRCITSVNMKDAVDDVMKRKPHEIDSDALVQEVALIFNTHRIPSVFVIAEGRPIGIVHIHSILGSGLI